MAKKNIEKARELAKSLAATADENLVSVIMFGALSRPGYDRDQTQVNLFVILHDASTKALRPLEPAIAKWAKAEPPPLVVSLEEWRASTDVFAIEIEDMRDAHEVLAGVDPFLDLQVSQTNLRHELERELRGKLLQLRSEYAAVAPDGKKLTGLLLGSIGTFFILMRALVRLTEGTPGADPEALVAQASKTAGVNPEAFDWVVRKISGQTVRSLQSFDPIGSDYVDAIEKLARFVDRLDVSDGTIVE